jgi:plasmid maintenance system antidote protein VapI
MKMTAQELEDFLIKYDMSNFDLAKLLSITKPAVDHWLVKRRKIPPTAAKLIKVFDEFPDMMELFK